jgi:hypothetical protein
LFPYRNPHTPGQRLRVKVPKDCFPGGTFKVTVPVKNPVDTDGKDRNKLPREFQDFLDTYARAYDDWCVAKSALDPEFNTWKEKQFKFDKMAKEFPSNLMTPIDPPYLKHVMRRSRQNQYKKKYAAAAAAAPKAEGKDDDEADVSDEEEEEAPESRIVELPGLGKVFPTIPYKESDFTA